MHASASKTVFSHDLHQVNVYRWLQGYDRFDEVISSLRGEADPGKRKQLKLSLPCIIPAGVFSAPNDQCLVKFSGLMCFDFDMVPDADQLKTDIMNNRHVWYVGLSASGTGLFALVKVAPDAPRRWKHYYAALSGTFGEVSKCVDKHCSNISRRRFYSHDPQGVFNFRAMTFRLQWRTNDKTNYPVRVSKPIPPDSNIHSRILYLVGRIEQEKKDITSSYNHWIAIGGSLASTLGESGRELFHRVGQFYSGYDPKETDAQYNRSLKRPPGFGPGIIFKIAKDCGLVLKDLCPRS